MKSKNKILKFIDTKKSHQAHTYKDGIGGCQRQGGKVEKCMNCSFLFLTLNELTNFAWKFKFFR